MVLEKNHALLVARKFAILAAQLDEAFLVLKEARRDDVRFVLEVAPLLCRRDKGPAEEAGRAFRSVRLAEVALDARPNERSIGLRCPLHHLERVILQRILRAEHSYF